jgi:hypothetical protein
MAFRLLGRDALQVEATTSYRAVPATASLRQDAFRLGRPFGLHVQCAVTFPEVLT